MQHDRRGIAVTSSSAAASRHLDAAVSSLLAHRADINGHLAAALEADAGFALARCLSGFLLLLLGRSDAVSAARLALGQARASLGRRGGTAREHALAAALDAWCSGEMELAAAILEASLADHPLDAMTVKLVHALRFMLGDAIGMRRSIESVLPVWSESVPGFGFMLGCHAFALEETGALAAAEAAGRHALSLEAEDVWACHAVAHVFDARNEPACGLAWIRSHSTRWCGVNNFARHLAWHEALFHLSRKDSDAALALYDSVIREGTKDDYRDIANAAALLLQLERHGCATGRRWEELAAIAERGARDHALVFARLHDLLCLIGAGRWDAAYRSFAAMDIDARSGQGTQARLLAPLGLPLAKLILAGGEAALPRSIAQLRRAIGQLGGSRAQRRTFEQILDDAMVGGQGRAVA